MIKKPKKELNERQKLKAQIITQVMVEDHRLQIEFEKHTKDKSIREGLSFSGSFTFELAGDQYNEWFDEAIKGYGVLADLILNEAEK